MENYEIRYDDKFGQLTHIDLAAEGAAHDPWYNQTLTTMNLCTLIGPSSRRVRSPSSANDAAEVYVSLLCHRGHAAGCISRRVVTPRFGLNMRGPA
jgi:hypothetical protein